MMHGQKNIKSKYGFALVSCTVISFVSSDNFSSQEYR